MVSVLFSPMHMSSRPSSQLSITRQNQVGLLSSSSSAHGSRGGSTNPLMTCPLPILKLKGVPRS